MQSTPQLDAMTRAEESAFLAAIADDDDATANGHLANGNPVYASTETTPAGVVEKIYPDGRRQYVRFDLAGEHFVAAIEHQS